MANFGNFLQDIAQKIPGNKFAQTRVGDVLTGGVARAVNRNKWEIPSVHGDQTSIDDLAAVGTGNSSRYRTAARTAGLGFGSWGMGELSGTPYLSKGLMGARNIFGGQGGSSQEGSSAGPLEPSFNQGNENNMGTSIWSQIGLPQDRGHRSIDDVSRNSTSPIAEQLASQGRFGDKNLLHVSDEELAQLNSTGKLTQNPNTGLPEAFSFGDPGQILGGAGNIFGGGVGWGLGNRASGDIQNAGNRGVSIGAPLENQQRQQYQQQLTGMMNDPSNFLNTD